MLPTLLFNFYKELNEPIYQCLVLLVQPYILINELTIYLI